MLIVCIKNIEWHRNSEAYNVPRVLHTLLYSLISFLLSDYDECAGSNGGCSQNCSNTVGSFFCSCGGGYILDDDMTSCNGIIIPTPL